MRKYSKYLIGKERTIHADKKLGWILAFVAGAINAGGFLAINQYTSHMTGMLSSIADDIVLGKWKIVLKLLIAILSFLVGTIICTILVNFAEKKKWHSKYALPLFLEALLILIFGIIGYKLSLMKGFLIPYTIIHLCFIMGMQNSLVTKISKSVIRTTHMTGVVTDLGIELGKLFYINIDKENHHQVKADRKKLSLLFILLLSFFSGAIIGAYGFKYIGYYFTIPIALILLLMASFTIFDDIKIYLKKD